jgi:hypothetical protein
MGMNFMANGIQPGRFMMISARHMKFVAFIRKGIMDASMVATDEDYQHLLNKPPKSSGIHLIQRNFFDDEFEYLTGDISQEEMMDEIKKELVKYRSTVEINNVDLLVKHLGEEFVAEFILSRI